MGDGYKTILSPGTGWQVPKSEEEIGAFQCLSTQNSMCQEIVLKNGSSRKTLCAAGTHDVKNGEMVLVCPKCLKAYVVADQY